MVPNRTFRAIVVLSVVLFAGFASTEDPTPYACETPRKEAGACVLIRECKALLELLKPDRRTSEVITYLKNSTCGFEGTTPRLCCPLKPSQAVEPTPTPKPWIDADSPTTQAMPNGLSEEPVDVSTSPRLNMLPLNSCGGLAEDKIINGQAVPVMQYPWMALLGYNTSFDQIGFHCGGTLINNRYVLTAAHCVTELLTNHKLTLVRLGELHIFNKTDCTERERQRICAPPVEEYNIEEVIAHPNYNKPTRYSNDIALIRLNQTITFKEHIRPICLPIGPEQRRDFTSKKMFVAGWGITEEGIRSPHLLKVLLPVVSHQSCAKSYEQSKIQVSESRQVCAGGDGKSDSCSGDSGGPLKDFGEVAEGVQQMVQFGVVSFGPKMCATKSLPGVYTKVGFYMDWILNTLRE